MEVAHHGAEAIVLLRVQIEHHDPQHVHDPGALLIHVGLIGVGRAGGAVAIPQPRDAIVAVVLDVPRVLVQEMEVFLVALANSLDVPQPGE